MKLDIAIRAPQRHILEQVHLVWNAEGVPSISSDWSIPQDSLVSSSQAEARRTMNTPIENNTTGSSRLQIAASKPLQKHSLAQQHLPYSYYHGARQRKDERIIRRREN